ncbi:MAG: YfhO family protein, partial [[Eubacterium] siraeum]
DNVYPFGNLSASVAFYIPLFSMAGVISFAWARKKSWLTIIMIICGVMAFVPVLNQLFSALNSAYYVRWLYMPMLIACVMSLSALEERVSFKPGIITCTAVVAAMMIYQAVVDTDGLIVRASHRTNFSVYQTMLHFAVTVLSLVLLIVIVKSKRDKDFIPKLYIFSLICAYMCYGVMVQYLYSSIPSVEATTAAFAFGEKLPEECREGSPRIALSATNANLIWGADSPSHLNSLHDEGFTQFLDDSSLGFESGVYERITFDYKEICDLISVKYFAGLGETGDKYDGCRKVGTMGEYAIYENPDYIPMGFVYDSMISRDAFLSIEDKKLKHLTYLKALIVSDTTVFSDILTDISNTAGEEITDDEYKRLIEDRRRSAASSCEKTSNGLTAQIELEKENVVFFSVSYNEGWSAYVDGEKTDVYNVNNGCVGVRVHEGRHEIRLCYTVKGFNEGIAITAVSSGILILYAAVCGIRRKNGKAEV